MMRKRIPRGMAYLLVLGLMAMTLGVAYGVMRSRVQDAMVQRNFSRAGDARQAAQAGLNIALRAMSTSGWTGVGTTSTGSLGNQMSYQVTFTAGDASLAPTDTSYPYRVTVLSIGTATDPTNTSLSSTYQIQTVMELIPRALGTQPAGYAATQNFTLFQWYPTEGSCSFEMDYPARIEGPLRLQEKATLCDKYPPSNTACNAFLAGVASLVTQWGGYDHRPLTHPVRLDFDSKNSTFRERLDNLGITYVDGGSDDSAVWSHPGTFSTYRLYPGGPTYSTETISRSSISDTTLEPTATNPLGIFCRSGGLTCGSNVTVRGTLINTTDLFLNGTNIHLASIPLLPLDGGTTPICLPVAQLGDDFRMYNNATAVIAGQIVVRNAFEVSTSDQWTQSLSMEGRIIGKQILLEYRSNWHYGNGWWNTAYSTYDSSRASYDNNFAWYLWSQAGLASYSTINIRPPSAPVTYFWKDATNTIYVADPSDGGLRWKQIRRQDGA